MSLGTQNIKLSNYNVLLDSTRTHLRVFPKKYTLYSAKNFIIHRNQVFRGHVGPTEKGQKVL